MECMPHGPLLFTSTPHLVDRCMCLLLGYKPHIFSFSLISSLLTLDYDTLGLWIKGESPDGAL